MACLTTLSPHAWCRTRVRALKVTEKQRREDGKYQPLGPNGLNGEVRDFFADKAVLLDREKPR
jgi:hypothetical protein